MNRNPRPEAHRSKRRARRARDASAPLAGTRADGSGSGRCRAAAGSRRATARGRRGNRGTSEGVSGPSSSRLMRTSPSGSSLLVPPHEPSRRPLGPSDPGRHRAPEALLWTFARTAARSTWLPAGESVRPARPPHPAARAEKLRTSKNSRRWTSRGSRRVVTTWTSASATERGASRNSGSART